MGVIHVLIVGLVLGATVESQQTKECSNAKSEPFCFQQLSRGLCKYRNVSESCRRSCLTCCADLLHICGQRKMLCHHWKFKLRMKHYCPKTCGYCGKALALPPCLNSKYGCCWDRSNAASAPIGSGNEKCPACRDVKSEIFCQHFKPECEDYHPDRKKGKQIRSYCPKTCRLCGARPVCMDDASVAHFCPKYEVEGLCKKNVKYMKFFCPKTCGFCKPCKDRLHNCEYLKKHHVCTQFPNRMKYFCQLTCNLC